MQSSPNRARKSHKSQEAPILESFSIHLRVLKSDLGLIMSWAVLQSE